MWDQDRRGRQLREEGKEGGRGCNEGGRVRQAQAGIESGFEMILTFGMCRSPMKMLSDLRSLCKIFFWWRYVSP